MVAAEQTPPTRSPVLPVEIVRVVVLIAALTTLVLWGFTSWPPPWSFVIGIGAPLIAALLWAVFLSPRPVLRVHPFIRALVELLIFATVTMCWWLMGQALIGIAFAVVAVTAGLLAGRRALS